MEPVKVPIRRDNHAACGHVHAAVDAALALKAQHGLKIEDITRIEAASYQKSVEICGNATPRTAFEAKFSLPYCVAAGLVLGSVRRTAFDPGPLGDPAIRALTAKVVHTVDRDCEAAFPKARSARVAIETQDGRFEIFAPTRKGDPDNPLTDAELDATFLELTEPVLGSAAPTLLARLRALESGGPITDLMRETRLPMAAE